MANKKGDKPAMKTSIEDIQNDMFKASGGSKLFAMNSRTSFTDKDKEAVKKLEEKLSYNPVEDRIKNFKEYNKTIHETISDSYKNYKPYTDFVVRVYVKEPEEGAIIIPFMDEIPIRNQSGPGVHHTIPNPYMYSGKAIVVSTPFGEKFIKPGDIIHIPETLVNAPVAGRDDILEIQYGFWLPEWKRVSPPTDPKNEHFGYLIIPRGIIKGFFSDKKDLNEK